MSGIDGYRRSLRGVERRVFGRMATVHRHRDIFDWRVVPLQGEAMSKSQKEMLKFLETATPDEIIKYWRAEIGDKQANAEFLKMFQPLTHIAYFQTHVRFLTSPRIWFQEFMDRLHERLHERLGVRRQNQIDKVTVAYRKHYRLAAIDPKEQK
jgi:hypothetical protein